MPYLCLNNDKEPLFDPTSGRAAAVDVWDLLSYFAPPLYARAMELKPVCCAVSCRCRGDSRRSMRRGVPVARLSIGC